MLIKIEVKTTAGNVYEYVSPIENAALFHITWALSQSIGVDQFRVEGRLPREFGFAEIPKWVANFTWR